MINPDFRKFIQTTLKRAGIDREHRESFTDPDGMKLFEKVFIHPTHDPENNHFELKFIGNGISKAILNQYLARKFPELASGESKHSRKGTGEGVLSKTRRFLEQTKALADFGQKLGFWEYIRADEETMTKLHQKLLLDVYEAFIGAIVEIVDRRIKRGLGYYYAYNFVTASLDEITIDIKKETLDDPITRLNELYKANELQGGKRPLKWGDAKYTTGRMYLPRVNELPPLREQKMGTVVFLEPEKTAYIATTKGWIDSSIVPFIELSHTPLDDPDEEQLNQLMWYAGVYGDPRVPESELIGQGLHFQVKEAKKAAATQALNYLHGLGFKKLSEPVHKKVVTRRKPVQLHTFREFIQSMLKRAKLNQEYRDLLTDKNGMELFRRVITHSSFDSENNYEEMEFIGDGIIKGILSQYIPRRFPRTGTTDGTLSKIRRLLEQRTALADFGLQLGFWNYVQADEETLAKLRKETLEDVFEAFVGALVEIVDTRIKRGFGYYFAYNFVEESLNDMPIEIKKETLDDPITRLNELYKANELEQGKKPLKWGDAIYTTRKMFLPRVDVLPPLTGREVGTLVFSKANKASHVATNKGWVFASRAPLMKFHYTQNPDPEQNQLMWYVGVYGFPGAPDEPPVDKFPKTQVLADPGAWGAELIGQGLHFKLKEAKKMAAAQALQLLHSKGFKKVG